MPEDALSTADETFNCESVAFSTVLDGTCALNTVTCDRVHRQNMSNLVCWYSRLPFPGCHGINLKHTGHRLQRRHKQHPRPRWPSRSSSFPCESPSSPISSRVAAPTLSCHIIFSNRDIHLLARQSSERQGNHDVLEELRDTCGKELPTRANKTQ